MCESLQSCTQAAVRSTDKGMFRHDVHALQPCMCTHNCRIGLPYTMASKQHTQTVKCTQLARLVCIERINISSHQYSYHTAACLLTYLCATTYVDLTHAGTGSCVSVPACGYLSVPTCSCVSVLTCVQLYMCTRHMQALAFLEVMQSSEGHIRPDTVTYNTVLKACCNAGQLARAMQASP